MTLDGWSYLVIEVWALVGLGALVGLVSGWLIWGGRSDAAGDLAARTDEVHRLRADVQRARAQAAWSGDDGDDIPPMQGGGYRRPQAALSPGEVPPQTAATPQPVPGAAPIAAPNPLPGTFRSRQGQTPMTAGQPETLAQARDGLPDDLTRIKGIGPKMERTCNSLGIWHYDQIAQWTPENVAWMENHLDGLNDRVKRDDWVAQAKAFLGNEVPRFRHR